MYGKTNDPTQASRQEDTHTPLLPVIDRAGVATLHKQRSLDSLEKISLLICLSTIPSTGLVIAVTTYIFPSTRDRLLEPYSCTTTNWQ